VRPAPRRQLVAYRFEELGYEVRGLFITVRLGQGGVAGNVCEQERDGRRACRGLGRRALIIVQGRYLLWVLPGL
jgi:tRNA U34 2-thiouridine synthase MnmA/TrmU